MTKRIFIFAKPVLLFLLIVLLIVMALDKSTSALTTEGLKLWAICVLPSMLPYSFISSVISSMPLTVKCSSFFTPLSKRIFNVNGLVFYALFISVICGYPLGTKTVSELKNANLLTQSESVRASAICSTSSLAFTVSVVGIKLFNSIKFGILLFLCNLLSVVILGVVFSFYKKRDVASICHVPITSAQQNILYDSAYSSAISSLICGTVITVFYIVTELLCSSGILNPLINLFGFVFNNPVLGKSLTLGLFECTNGLKILSSTNVSVFTLPVCAFICSFGGLSVIMQSIPYLKKAKIKIAPFLIAKICGAIISFILGLISYLLFF